MEAKHLQLTHEEALTLIHELVLAAFRIGDTAHGTFAAHAELERCSNAIYSKLTGFEMPKSLRRRVGQ